MRTAEWQAQVETSRAAFGSMLRRWRKQQGWTQYTACHWAKAAGFETISYGNLSVIEQGTAGDLRAKAFLQLAEINERLAARDFGVIQDVKLKALVEGAAPLAESEGDAIWGAEDFWRCYQGLAPVPERYSTDHLPDLDERSRRALLKRWRLSFQQLAKSSEFRPSHLLQQLGELVPAAVADPLEAALLGAKDLTADQLGQLWDSQAGCWRVDGWLAQLGIQ
jgi:transcriptional regulator with XRE-family HTH domain